MPATREARQRQKELGAFYTPPEMAAKLVDWCVRDPGDTVLDPSFGGLVFLRLAKERLIARGAEATVVGQQVCGIDVDPDAVREARNDEFLADCELALADFFNREPREDARFAAIIGNPPYVRYQSWNGSADRAHAVAKAVGVRMTRLSSAWAPFVIQACRFLQEDGRLGQVLPAELLHSQYARPVVDFLRDSFSAVTIVVFDERVFPGALEEVVLLFADGYGHGPAEGIGVVSCRDVSELNLDMVDGKGRGYLRPDLSLLRLLPHDTQRLYEALEANESVHLLGGLASVDIGIVTGANHFFLRQRDEIASRGFAPELFRTAVSKASAIRGVRFSTEDATALAAAGEKTELLVLNDAPGHLVETVRVLIDEGEADGLHERYKCRIREPWFAVPVPKRGAPDAFLTYMSNSHPRLAVNEAGAWSTNTVHGIRMEDGRSAASLSVAFYNSLTLLSAELVGRSYGGGILKLEPTEAERLLVPEFGEEIAQNLPLADAKMRSADLSGMIELVDKLVLEPLGLSERDISRLRRARKTLAARRIGRGSRG